VELEDNIVSSNSVVDVKVDGKFVIRLLAKRANKVNVRLVQGDVTLDSDDTIGPPQPFGDAGVDDGKTGSNGGGVKPVPGIRPKK
jgi:hypothetical protein